MSSDRSRNVFEESDSPSRNAGGSDSIASGEGQCALSGPAGTNLPGGSVKSESRSLWLHNGQCASGLDDCMQPWDQFRDLIVSAVRDGARVAALWARPLDVSLHSITAVLAYDADSMLRMASTTVGAEYPSLTPLCPEVHMFEREMWEQHGIVPVGHPWLKPVRFSRTGLNHAAQGPVSAACGVTDFFRVDGAEVHEVAVGPVHAGVIEPGHFRFQCHGEKVFHLEISLGYQHRGVERALRGGPGRRSIHHVETLAGDTTIGHTIAYCSILESLAGVRVPPRAEVLRGIALELERVANHIGDLGALAGDVGFLPTQAYCGRLRGDALNLTATLCGNRFGRGFVRPGGVAYNVDGAIFEDMKQRLRVLGRDTRNAVELLWSSPSVMARFDRTGVLGRTSCERLGIVGVAARAGGVARDVRRDFPSGIFCFAQIPISGCDSGDVFARAYVRWLEVQRSMTFIQEQLSSLPAGTIIEPVGQLRPDCAVVSLVEGWRGEICHAAVTDRDGRFAVYKVVDPSFHNWFGLAMALRNEQISDFPLCNKSFNLSYCGHDL